MKLKLVLLAILLSAATAGTLAAQDKPSAEVRFLGGSAAFLDDDNHTAVGGSIGFYLTRRLSIQPEFLYMIASGSHRDITVIPHLAYDFRPEKSVRPYLIGGAGLLHQRNEFFGNTFTHNEWSANFGVGVKVFVTPRVFLAPDFRIGWEPIARFTGGIGFVF